MIKKVLYFFLLYFILISCKKHTFEKRDFFAEKLISQSKVYIGTPYGSGGTTSNSMDCSGFIYRTFLDLNQNIPRVAYQQAAAFDEVGREKLKAGDLLYFVVASNKIDHTGLVVEVKGPKEINFIHASTMKGVRIDNLYSNYWMPKFVKATRPVYRKSKT
jgi:probable lipoprotein NlpC